MCWVLAAGHQQVHPAHGRAPDADEDFVRLQARRVGPLHGLERQVMFHGLHGAFGEFTDDDFVALGHVQSCGVFGAPAAAPGIEPAL
jgi:hypothetical protein